MSYRPRTRLFVEHTLKDGAVILLQQKQMHYLIHVMRLNVADCIYVFNGQDGEWLAEITAVRKRDTELRLISQSRMQKSVPDIWLLFAPIKQGSIDFLAQKATELGVSRLLPVITERTNVTRVNMERLRANAIEAAEQSERLCIPKIDEPKKFLSLLGNWDQNRPLLFCDETGKGKSMDSALKNAPHAILIGPEGGFSDAEIETLRRLPYVISASLGPRILRADTAALAALACWQMVWGDWNATTHV